MPPWPKRTIGRPGPRPGQQHDASHSLAVGAHLVIVGITCRLQQRVWQKGPDELTEPAGPLAPSPGGLVGAPLVKQDRFVILRQARLSGPPRCPFQRASFWKHL